MSNRSGRVRGYTNAIYTGFPTNTMAEILTRIIKHEPELQGIYHLASEPISKYELLKMTRDKFGLDIEIEPFADFRIDRSLDSTRFRKETNFIPETWETMITAMSQDRTPYDAWRKKLIR